MAKPPGSWEEFTEALEDEELAKLIGYYYQSPEDQRRQYAAQYPLLQAWSEEGWRKQYPGYEPGTEEERRQISKSYRRYVGSLYEQWYYQQLQGQWQEPYTSWSP